MSGRSTAAPSRSVVWVGGGLAVYGLASFAFLAIGARALGRGADYTALALLWTLLNGLGIGLYLPIEQETSRSVSGRRSLGRATADAVRRPLRYGGASLAVLAVAAAVSHVWLQHSVFADTPGMTPVLVASLAGMAVAYLARGVLGGNGRFPRYGLQLAVDGGSRVAGVLVLATAGVHQAVWYGVVLAVAPLLGTAIALVRPGTLLTRSTTHDASGGSMAALVLASLSSQALANAGPVAAQLLAGPGDASIAGTLVNALSVARVPLFLFAAVQAVFLPRLARHVVLDDERAYRSDLRTATLATAVIGALGVLGSWLVGPWAVRLLFGPAFDIDRGTVTLLALSAALFMNAQVFVQGLLARSHDRHATLSWTCGLVALLLTLVAPLPLAARVSLALTVGSAAALLTSAVAVRRTLVRW